MPTLPPPDAYNEAVQSPKAAFRDPVLANGQVECNGFGIPKALGGGFAITYKVIASTNRSYAVRCFHKDVRDLQERYRRIHDCLSGNRSDQFVEFEYQHEGIRVRGQAFPLVKMAWASGTTLGQYLESSHTDQAAITKLRSQFASLEQQLASKAIAHGDLQNGNVLVHQGTIQLVDYDGMYVPGMAVGKGAELGHKHFQHPLRRGDHFGPAIDRFSFIVIDLSLWALALRPALFKQFSTGENILFSANDYVDPDSSSVFQTLRQLNDTSFQQSLADFAKICQADVTAVPTLSDFLAHRGIPQSVARPIPTGFPTQYIGALPVLRSDFGEVCRHIGDRVELVGKVYEVKVGSTRKGTPYVFINFGHWRDDTVRATIWSEGLKVLGVSPDASWVGQWIVVNGLVDPVYHGKNRYKTIQYRSVGITVADKTQIHKVSQAEAMWRLGQGPNPTGVHAGSHSKGPQASVADRNAGVLQSMSGKTSREAFSTRRPHVGQSPKQSPVSPPQSKAGQGGVTARNQEILRQLGGQATTSGRQSSSTGSPSAGGTSSPKPNSSGCAVVLATLIALTSCVAIAGYLVVALMTESA